VWALLGLYPLVGSEWYVLGSPTFFNVTLGLGSMGGGALTILARNASGCGACVYVASVALNGRALAAPFVRHSELLQAPALLEFVMTDSPAPWDYVPPV
jgi:putative alpha-1,2-mannosidase